MPVRNVAFLALLLGLLAAGLVGAAAPAAARSCDPCPMVTTTSLNLRSGPGTTYEVRLVMPQGAEVLVGIERVNDFAPVTYNGTSGWAAAQYLTTADTGGNPGDSPVVIGSAVATVDLNLRAGPGTNHQVLRVLPRGATVQTTDFAAAGYRYVIHEGLSGWVAEQYLGTSVPGEPPYDPNYATATAYVNLRAEPSLRGTVLAVLAAGTRVRLNPEFANGFRGVEYNGVNGWVYTAYLN